MQAELLALFLKSYFKMVGPSLQFCIPLISHTSSRFMNICKSIDKRIWLKSSPLFPIPKLSREIIYRANVDSSHTLLIHRN